MGRFDEHSWGISLSAINRAVGVVDAQAGRVEQLQTALTAARRAIEQASPLRPELAHLDAVLDRDARARARHARLDPDNAVGDRPGDLEAAREWDRVVGERAQHDAAYPQEPPLTDLLADLGGLSLSVGHEPLLGARRETGVDLDL